MLECYLACMMNPAGLQIMNGSSSVDRILAPQVEVNIHCMHHTGILRLAALVVYPPTRPRVRRVL